MKKVLSVAMASAMVLGMGANAFAIEYSTGSNDTASWPKGFAFEGSLFVTNADDEIVKESTTAINKKQNVNFEPGDVIWMPLYADNQKVYGVAGNQTGYDKVAATTVTFNPVLNNVATAEELISVDGTGKVAPFIYRDTANKVEYTYGKVSALTTAEKEAGWRTATVTKAYTTVNGVVSNAVTENKNVDTWNDGELPVQVVTDAHGVVTKFSVGAEFSTYDVLPGNATPANTTNIVKAGDSYVSNPRAISFDEIMQTLSPSQLVNGNRVRLTIDDAYATTAYQAVLKAGVQVVAELPEVAAVTESLGNIVDKNQEKPGQNFVNTVAHGHYTGNIDKNWSINLIEKDGTVSDLVEKAELYKADEADYLSYKGVTNEIQPNAVYLKVTLKDEWKTTKSETLKYYVYVADNKSEKADNKTNEVWVSGTYENTDFEYVNFDWSNDASRAKLWKVRKDESGKAVFDFADKVFFTVKMYGGESMYLDLNTAYDKVMAGEFDAEFDSFYKFSGSNANFARSGELVIASGDDSLSVYEINEDGDLEPVDAEYVKDYKIAGINEKVNGFKFNTKQLGNYVLSTEELGAEEEVEEPEVDEEEAPEVEETPEVEEVPETNKPNPETGAEDFVGLAVSLAVVSVAAAGALALKK